MEFSCSQRFQPNLWKEALSSFRMWSHHNSLLFRSLLVNKYMLIIVQLLKDSKFDFFLLTSCLIALKMAPYVFLNVFPRITGISVQKNKPRLGYMSSSWLCEIGLICTDLLCLQWLVLEIEKMLETDVEYNCKIFQHCSSCILTKPLFKEKGWMSHWHFQLG